MGRQTQVAMTEVDEAAFLEFLRRGADIQLIGSSARTPEGLSSDFAVAMLWYLYSLRRATNEVSFGS